MKSLVSNLNHLLKEKSISLTKLSRETGIPQPTLYHLKSGKTKRPRLAVSQTIASYFNISVEQLLYIDLTQHRHDIEGFYSVPIVDWELIKSSTTAELVSKQYC